jgi:superfamily I DNA/RNA helicase
MAGEQKVPELIFPGPVALVAGPGSGKTTRLAARVKHLVEVRGANPEEITVITFTVEAARNMKARLTPPAKKDMPDVTLPPEKHPAIICTMHSLGARIVSENLGLLGLKEQYRVIDRQSLREMLFQDAARLCGEMPEFGDQCEEHKRKHGQPADDREARVFDRYRRILRACNAIDFDDQIILACEALDRKEEVRERWRARARNLLVDEYQDINTSQLELIRLLSGLDASGLFVVGDDDQSIYAFRGAEPSYIREFAKHLGAGARVEAVADCYRCQPHIIKAAHGFIAALNPDRIPKPVPDGRGPEGPRVRVHSAPSDTREAEIVATIIDEALRAGDVLVLLPRDGYAEPLKAELAKRRINFDAPRGRVSDATGTFAALRHWLADNGNNLALRELIAAVADGGALGFPGPRSKLADKLAERENALSRLSALWAKVLGDGLSLYDSLRQAAGSDPLYDRLIPMVNEMAQAVEGSALDLAQRTFNALRPWPSGRSILDELAAMPVGTSREGDARIARIMTMRNSKGLEAETVVVLGLEEEGFPRSKPETPEFKEDARLFYVSMTRARNTLHLFHARKRSGGMTHRPQSFDLPPSPFLNGVPEQHREPVYHPSASQVARREASRRGRRR